MKLTIFWPASTIAGRSSATTAAAAAARPTASTTQLTRLSPRSSFASRSSPARRRFRSASIIVDPPFGWSDGVGEETQEAVGEQEHEHRQQWYERRVHALRAPLVIAGGGSRGRGSP